MKKTNHVALNKLSQKGSTAYRFGDPDPILDLLRTAISTAIEERHMTIPQIAADAMCAYQTVARIVDGQTRYPMNGTVERILNACGFKRSIVRAISDAHGKELDPQKLLAVMEQIASKAMTQVQIVTLVKKTLGKK